ncbi:MAG: hypothetical protein Q4G03_12395 [Planctomycetia bacterium]|nr:hypothetical protein [Planctomycetia bacterium]
MKRLLLILICFLICSTTVALGVEPQQRFRKKFIELGWDIPTTQYLREHWQSMEASAPFAGVIYDLVANNSEGAKCSSQSLFTADAWNRDDFLPCIDDLKSCSFERFKDNFIRVNFYPADFEWDDDNAWKNVCEKVAICAWVAHRTGGNLCLDFESYGSALFRYKSESGVSFEHACRLARKRGAEFAAAAFQEKQDLVLLCLWMNSINYGAARTSRPEQTLRGASYGLLPAFIDGMLDAAPLSAKFVEGCENGYYMNGREQYQRASLDAKLDSGSGVALVSPENRAKYRQLVSSGFGFYLDMYTNPEGSHYYRGPEPGETRFDRLRVNLQAAWDCVDEYVWVYGEQRRWWAPQTETPWRSWEEDLPGVSALLRELADPREAARELQKKIANSSDAENLVVNGDFSQVDLTNNSAASWSTWRHEESHGRFQVSPGAVKIIGDSNACYIQALPVVPGQRYLLSGTITATGDASGALVARWQNSARKWIAEPQDVRISPESTNDSPDGTGEAIGCVEVPADASYLVLLLSGNADAVDEVVTFEKIEAYLVK